MWKNLLYIAFSYLVATAVCDVEVSYDGPRYVEEGSTFIITCRLSPGLILKWTKNFQTLSGPQYNMTTQMLGRDSQLSKLIVQNATTNHSGDYRCYTFENKVFHEISVIYDMDGKSNVVVLNLDQDTTLYCNMSQDSTVNITWFKNDAPIDFSQSRNLGKQNSSLVISSGSDSDAGTYACAVAGDASRNITFYVKSRVRVVKFDKSINAVQGEKLVLTCTCFGNPTPVVTWFKDNVNIKETNLTQRIKFLQDENNVTDAKLIIEHLEENDRAMYTCHVANDVNEANVTVMVRVKDKLAALWPFLGILAEVAVLCTIIFIYEKRRAKQEYDESDTDPNNDSKPATEQKKEDVRQRK